MLTSTLKSLRRIRSRRERLRRVLERRRALQRLRHSKDTDEEMDTSDSSSACSGDEGIDLNDDLRVLRRTENEKQQEVILNFLKRAIVRDATPMSLMLIEYDMAPRLVQLMWWDGRGSVQLLALLILHEMCATTEEVCLALAEWGLIPRLRVLMTSQDVDLQEEAIATLARLANHRERLRELVHDANVLDTVLEIVNAGAKISVLRYVANLLAHLCRGGSPSHLHMVAAINRLLEEYDLQILDDATNALAQYIYHAEGEEQETKNRAVLDIGAIRRCVEVLGMDPYDSTIEAILTTIGELSYDPVNLRPLIELGVLPRLLHLLENGSAKYIRVKACKVLANFAAGGPEHIRAVNNALILPTLVGILDTDPRNTTYEQRYYAIKVIRNVAGKGDVEHVGALVNMGCMETLSEQLMTGGSRVMLIALDSLWCALANLDGDPIRASALSRVRASRGVERLRELRRHADEDVRDKAMRLLRKWFEQGEEADTTTPLPGRRPPRRRRHSSCTE